VDLLVLGGTSFAGRHVVTRALQGGHSVTVFNRGRTNPGLFTGVRTLQGDRSTGDYDALSGAGPFDAVVDMCAYVPRAVRQAVAALGPGGLNGPYVLISSISAYAGPPAPDEAAAGFTEDSPLAALPPGTDPASEDVTGETTPWFPGSLVVDLEQILGQRVQVVIRRSLSPLIRDAVLWEAVPL